MSRPQMQIEPTKELAHPEFAKVRSGIFIAAGCAFAFGLYPTAARLAYKDGASPALVIIVTTFFRAAAMVALCLISRKPLLPGRHQLKDAVTGGFFQALSIFGIIASLEYLPGPVMITLVFTNTIMLLFFMAYLGEAPLTKNALVSTIVALLGISFVVDVWTNMQGVSGIGVALALGAAVATMSRVYVFGRQVQQENPAVVGARVFCMAFLFTLFLLPVCRIALPQGADGLFWLGACSLSLALGTYGVFYGIALLGPFRFSLMLKAEPVFTAIFSVLILGEVLSAQQYMGIALVMGSLVAYQCIERRG